MNTPGSKQLFSATFYSGDEPLDHLSLMVVDLLKSENQIEVTFLSMEDTNIEPMLYGVSRIKIEKYTRTGDTYWSKSYAVSFNENSERFFLSYEMQPDYVATESFAFTIL